MIWLPCYKWELATTVLARDVEMLSGGVGVGILLSFKRVSLG